MMHHPWLIAGLVALVVLGVAGLLVSQLSSEARMRRRRRKNHSPLVSKARRPNVRFSVRPPKE
jgi:hypothetical protein